MTGTNGNNGNGPYTDREKSLMIAMGEAVRDKLEEVRNSVPMKRVHQLLDLSPPEVTVTAPEVNVTNQVAAPIVNVESPNVEVAAPVINVSIDMTPVAEALGKLADAEHQEAQRQERLIKALKLMGDQQQSMLGQILAGQKSMTDALLTLAEALSKQPPVEVKPNIAIDMEPVAKAIRQIKKKPRLRSVKITHSDGTASVLTEE